MNASRSVVQPTNFVDRERDILQSVKREQEFGETMLKREREMAIELQKSNQKSMEIKEETSRAIFQINPKEDLINEDLSIDGISDLDLSHLILHQRLLYGQQDSYLISHQCNPQVYFSYNK